MISCRLCEHCSKVARTLIQTAVIVFPDRLKSICEGKKKKFAQRIMLTNLFMTFSQPIRLQFLIGLLYDLWFILFDFSFDLRLVRVITFNYIGPSSPLRRIRTFRRWRRRVCTLVICIARTLGCSRRLRMLWSWKRSST